MKHNPLRILTGTFLFAAVLPSLPAAVVPYSENFDSTATGDNVPANFTEAGTGGVSNITIQADGGGNDYQFALGSGQNLSSAIQLTNVAGINFSLSVEITADAFTNGTGTLNTSIGFLSNTSNLSATGAGESRYLLTFNPISGTASAGRLLMSQIGSTGFVATGGSSIISSEIIGSQNLLTLGPLGTVYTLTLSGNYDTPGRLTLTGTVSNGASSISVFGYDGASILSGNYFGMRAASSAVAGASANFDFDNFTATAVPEPSVCLMLSLGALLVFSRRRSLLSHFR